MTLIRRWTMVGDEVIHSRETADASAVGARPLVLLHGVGTTTRYFRPLLRELDGRAAAVAPELPGIGSSSSERLPKDIAGQADVVAAWLRTTGRRAEAVVGNSVGAQAAVELAIRHPELVGRLVLIGPTMDRAARSFLSQASKLLVDATVEHPGMIALTLTDSLLTRRRAVYRSLRAALSHHLEERIPLVTVPILIIRGQRDPIVPRRWARELVAAATPRAELVEVPGGAHACHYGQPKAVADLVVGERVMPTGQPIAPDA